MRLSQKHHRKSKITLMVEEGDRTKREETKRNVRRITSEDLKELPAPFHMGILPSQYNLEQSELEKVGGKKRRKEW